MICQVYCLSGHYMIISCMAQKHSSLSNLVISWVTAVYVRWDTAHSNCIVAKRGVGHGRRAAAAIHNIIGSTIKTTISLHLKLRERRNRECTHVFKVPVFAKVMPGVQLLLYAQERLHALMWEDSTVKHAMTELGKEGIQPCRQTVWRFWVHYRRNKTTKPLPRSSRPTKLTERVQELIQQKMQSDAETTVKELALLIRSKFGYWISLHTVLKGRKLLG